MTIATLIDLNLNEYNHGLSHYPFTINLDRSNGSCNTLVDPSCNICVPNKAGTVNLNVFNMITGIKMNQKTLKELRNYNRKLFLCPPQK